MASASPLSVAEGYAAWADLYDHDGNPLIALEGPAVRAMLDTVAGLRILDLGCGTGRHTSWLVDSGALVVGLDSTPEMLAKARQKLTGRRVTWVEHDLTTLLPFPDATFDAVLLGLVVEHIAEVRPVFAEIARLLRPEGRFVLSNLHPDRTADGQQARFIDPQSGERRSIVSHHRTIEQYRSAADRAGFDFVCDQTLIVPAALTALYPRAAPYVGMSLGWVAKWKRGTAGSSNADFEKT